ncbi:DNA adenine methylase [Rhodococcus sp. NPDC058521]|uniref:DNA adenine methylase n=1 Tax=Rhodococcus sp. NPDC058521 TaxID=3346536 RepID=UPI003654A400
MVESQSADTLETNQGPVGPFLRWAGGKRWLASELIDLIGDTPVRSYHEPFVGGGSIFFALNPNGPAHLSDLNSDLITAYIQVRDNPSAVAEFLAGYENTSECYYSTRAAIPKNDSQLAARFIFLNHTSFNGIFRVNLKGEYNVPFGNRRYLNIPDEPALNRASQRLQNVELRSLSFAKALDDVSEGDLAFLDPPYTVAHNNNGFVKYNQQLFSFEDQRRLAESIEEIKARGGKYILTNAAHKSIDDLFSPLGRKILVSRKSVIGGVKANRGRVDEYIFTNIGTE